MNKNLRLCFLMIAVTALLAGCSSVSSDAKDRPHIVTTVYAAYDLASAVAGPDADVTLLLKPGAESHTFEPTPRDIIDIGKSDILICSGGENDTWVDTLLGSVDSDSLRVIRMLELVDALEEEIIEGMEAEEEEEDGSGEEEPEWDEHVWMSPLNAVLIAEGISSSLALADPAHADAYAARCAELSKELRSLDAAIREVVSSASRHELVFADRFPARYFVEEYGLSYLAAFPGCSENTEASAATVSFLIDRVFADNIPVVLKIELSSGKLADTVAAETGAEVMTFFTGHNVTKEDFEAGMSYLDMMYRNLEVLKAALG